MHFYSSSFCSQISVYFPSHFLMYGRYPSWTCVMFMFLRTRCKPCWPFPIETLLNTNVNVVSPSLGRKHSLLSMFMSNTAWEYAHIQNRTLTNPISFHFEWQPNMTSRLLRIIFYVFSMASQFCGILQVGGSVMKGKIVIHLFLCSCVLHLGGWQFFLHTSEFRKTDLPYCVPALRVVD